ILIRCERISAFRKNEYKQDLCSDYSDRIIIPSFPITYPIEYSTKKIVGFRTTQFFDIGFPKPKMRNFVQFLRIGSLRKNYNHKLGGFS
ncbi:MAG: hypothetical protein KKE59_03810, partial [Proteobacteria bacterium]|nr:hypothetical protein [Pseudomonadota bacterium]